MGACAGAGFPRHGRIPVSQLQKRVGTGHVAGTGVGLADELLEDARDLGTRGIANKRASSMRRAISTAYYAAFHLFVEDFVEHWEFEDQRARLGRMFNHRSEEHTSELQSLRHLVCRL